MVSHQSAVRVTKIKLCIIFTGIRSCFTSSTDTDVSVNGHCSSFMMLSAIERVEFLMSSGSMTIGRLVKMFHVIIVLALVNSGLYLDCWVESLIGLLQGLSEAAWRQTDRPCVALSRWSAERKAPPPEVSAPLRSLCSRFIGRDVCCSAVTYCGCQPRWRFKRITGSQGEFS